MKRPVKILVEAKYRCSNASCFCSTYVDLLFA